ncbi:E3 ubiquitin-protein ligase CIP8-like [Dioscorea cayenensis subsp. rotundata]|uniref:E3 ubiquitin-protein ligase CIP8-like n=1 Tax=Dioscorea cayennensis subsp. rotundata TaxID=55577 RepID=A0AB40BXU8_DIOCR|nr:E3 ubiquitin-protein ligase CIP8-like [Dioscorea cayenensis subsp. rotundata]
MSSSILPSCLVRQSPFSHDPNWFYMIHSPLGNLDLHRLEPNIQPPPPSLTIDLNFGSQLISSFINSNQHELTSTTETKTFILDIQEFNQRFSAELAINTMFMNTSTGATLPIERRRWMVADIANVIVSFVRDGICFAYNEIFINLDVADLVQDDVLNEILQESFEDSDELSVACPASHVLLESLVTDQVVFSDDEAVSCVICLEEFVSGDVIKRLPCSHVFHGDCIDGWFVRKDSCPLCRFTLHV